MKLQPAILVDFHVGLLSPGHDVKLPRPGLPGPVAPSGRPPRPGGWPGSPPAVAIAAHRLDFAAPRRLRAGRVAHTLPPRIPCARRRGRQHCDHVANFWRDQPAFIPYKTQSFLKLVRYVRMRTSSSLGPAGDVLIAGLTVEVLYGIFLC